MWTLAGGLFGAAIGLVLGIVVLLILGFVLRILWNSTITDIFGVKPVTTWQAIKLLFIASLLFGGHRVVTVDQPGPPDEASVSTSSGP